MEQNGWSIQRKRMFSVPGKRTHCLCVLDGKVMLYNLTRHGNRKILFFLGRGKLLNHNICDTRPVSVFCETVCPAVLLEIPLERFQKYMNESMELTGRILREYERYIWRLSHQLKTPQEVF